jgi:hypothetical protein
MLAVPLLGAAFLGAQTAVLDEQLHDAVRKGDLALTRSLLDRGANVNAKGLYDQTPLFFAADRGHLEIVRLLIDRGAQLDAKDSFYNMTPLARAAMKQRRDVILLLLDKGAPGAGQLLFQAVASDDATSVQLLLDSKKLAPRDLSNALKFAEVNQKTGMIELLKAGGAQPPPPPTLALDPPTLAAYAGVYLGGRGGNEFEATVTVADGKLKLSLRGQTLTLSAFARNEFRAAEQETVTVAFRLENGRAVSLTIDPGNQEFTRKP